MPALQPYPAYRESGVPWLGDVPAHWETERAKRLFREVERPVRPSDEVVTCFRDGVVTLRKNRRVRGFTESLKEFGYQGIRRGDLVIHAMDAFAGAAGVSDSDGKGTSVYSVCVPDMDCVNVQYYAHGVREMARSQWILALSKGIRERSTDFRYSVFGSQLVPLPPPSEQTAIVRFLDHADRHIQRYIRTKEKLIALLEEQRKNTSQEILQSSGAKSHRLEDVADLIKRPIERVQNETYTPIGLYNRGRGIFRKQARSGSDLGDSDFFWIEEGDLVISGQFAWEGAIALASNTEASCVASHRYPILRGKLGILDTGFLLSFFQTGWGQLLLDHHSRGAAGRNRPLNARTLMKEKISLPPLQSQLRITEMLRQEYSVRQQVKRWSRLLGEYRARLIADVVTGKLDVREATATLPEVDPLADNDEVGDDLGASEAPAFDHEDQPAEVMG